jgi:hypothetical protein
MTNSDEHTAGGRPAGEQQQWWFCTRHMRVEPADTACLPKDLLGPYPTSQEAARALEKVKERNEAWDAQD